MYIHIHLWDVYIREISNSIVHCSFIRHFGAICPSSLPSSCIDHSSHPSSSSCIDHSSLLQLQLSSVVQLPLHITRILLSSPDVP